MKSIAVLGAGQGGITMAADLSLKGYDVRLFELPRFKQNLENISKRGGIDIKGVGLSEGLAKIKIITTEAKDAVSGAELIAIAVPCFGHEEFSRQSIRYLEDGQVVCFFGEGSGSMVFRKLMRDMSVSKNIVVGETNTLHYLTRITGPAEVRGRLKTGGVVASALPAKDTPELVKTLNEIYPFIESAQDVIETITLNFNAIDHVPTFVLNLGRIEGSSGDMRFWGEGATPSVVKVIEALDEECTTIRKAYGSRNEIPFKDWIYKQGFLDGPKATTYEAIHGSAHQETSTFKTGPEAKFHRYVTEDVPYALVLLSELAKVAGVETPVVDALIDITSVFNETDYRRTGRTLARLGLNGMSVKQIRKYVAG